MFSFIIQPGETEQTLISFLKKRFKTTPRTLIYKLLRTKKIKVGGQNVRYYHYRLKEGEKIEIYDNYLKSTPNHLTIYPLSQSKIYFQVIYEDKNVLIVLKEHGITMPSLDNAVRDYVFKQNQIEYQKQQEDFLVLTAVHRLDKLTKGLVIYPKTPLAKRTLYKAIGDKDKITKKYLAWCENFYNQLLPSFIQGYLGKHTQAQKMIFFLTPQNKAKYCAMEVKEIKRRKHLVLFEITLQTGRKHQIRSILSYFGYPIVGDEKYGSKLVDKTKIDLAAYKIKFNKLSPPLSYLEGKEFQIKV